MKKKYFSMLLIFFIQTGLFSEQPVKIVILQTTDIHGWLNSYDYLTESYQEQGLTRIQTMIKRYRDEFQNVILVDCGDLLQGTMLTDFYNNCRPDQLNPLIEAFNLMKYDAFVPGNHDIEQGLQICKKSQAGSNFPWLCANGITADGTPFYQPYLIKEISGIKIGLLGLTSPGIPAWMDESLYRGISWEDMKATALQYVPILRNQVDVLVGLFHSGFNYDPESIDNIAELPPVNASGIIADEVPGFDVIFAGHSHELLPAVNTISKKSPDQPLMINSGSQGRYLGVVELNLIYRESDVQILSASAWLDKVAGSAEDPELSALIDVYHQETIKYADTVIGHSSALMDGSNSRYKDTSLIDLLNNVQLYYTNADISITTSFRTDYTIPAGDIRIRDIYAVYPYSNTLCTISMTGEEIHNYLVFNSQYYACRTDSIASNPEVKGYNFDLFEGIQYTINPCLHQDERISDFYLLPEMQRISPNDTYIVALNSFRLSGGGGHLKAAGIIKPEILTRSVKPITELIIDYLKLNDPYQPECNYNWHIAAERHQ